MTGVYKLRQFHFFLFIIQLCFCVKLVIFTSLLQLGFSVLGFLFPQSVKTVDRLVHYTIADGILILAAPKDISPNT